jgi:hypothetical protein
MAEVIDLDIMPPVFQGGLAPEQLHAGQFGFAGDWGENSVLKAASETAGSMWERLNALHDLRVNRNPEDEPAVHARKLSRLIEEGSRQWASEWDRVKADLKRERSRVEGELDRAANLKVNPDYRNAIVGVFSGMKPEERMAAIQQAIAEGDGGTIATLLEAPALVTGLTGEQRAAIKVQVYQRANPTAHALLNQLDKAIVRAEAASVAAIDATMKLAGGTDRFNKKVEQAKALEQKVRSGFTA